MENNPAQTLKKTPRQQRSKALVDAILESATRVLKKVGYTNTTTNWVAEVAGISVGSLYQYFPNKDAIVHFLIQKSIKDCIEKGQAKLNAVDDKTIEASVETFVAFVVDLFAEYRDELRAIFKTALFVEHLSYLHKMQAGFEQILEKRLKEFSDEIQMESPALSSFILHHAIIGIMQSYVIDESRQISKEDLNRELRRVVLGYLRFKN